MTCAHSSSTSRPHPQSPISMKHPFIKGTQEQWASHMQLKPFLEYIVQVVHILLYKTESRLPTGPRPFHFPDASVLTHCPLAPSCSQLKTGRFVRLVSSSSSGSYNGLSFGLLLLFDLALPHGLMTSSSSGSSGITSGRFLGSAMDMQEHGFSFNWASAIC